MDSKDSGSFIPERRKSGSANCQPESRAPMMLVAGSITTPDQVYVRLDDLVYSEVSLPRSFNLAFKLVWVRDLECARPCSIAEGICYCLK